MALSSSLSVGRSPAQEPDWLEWQPPPECPSGAHIQMRVAELLRGPIPSEAELRVGTSLIWMEEHWEIEVRIAFDGQAGVRRIAVDSCTEAADFVAVAVALALDPNQSKTESEDSLDVRRSPPNPAPKADDLDAGSDTDPQPPVQNEQRIPEQESAAQGDAGLARPPLLPVLSLGAVAAVGPLPGPRLGFQLGAGLERGRWAFGLLGAFFPPVATEVNPGSDDVAFSLLHGRATCAYLFGDSGGRLGPQLALNLGTLRARQRSDEAEAVWRPWFSVGVGATGAMALSRFVDIVGTLNLDVPMTQPTFGLDDQSEIYRVTVGARGELGIQVSFEAR